MKILVTGGAGYIGDVVVEHLLGGGHTVSVMDNLLYSDSYMRPGVYFSNLDINSKGLTHLIQKYDAIVHLAAIVGDAACTVDRELTVNTNVKAVKRIVDTLEKYSPKTRLIFASTCSVYGASPTNTILTEESKTNPLSLYAETKLEAEDIIKKSSLDYTIFRLGTIFGQSSQHGRIRSDLVANILTYKAARGMPLSVFGGEQYRPLVSVRDVGRMFAEAAEDYSLSRETYILSYDNYTIEQIAEHVSNITGFKEIEKTDVPFEDLRNYIVDNSKARKAGLSAFDNIYIGITDMYKSVASNRIKDPFLSKYNNYKYLKELYESVTLGN